MLVSPYKLINKIKDNHIFKSRLNSLYLFFFIYFKYENWDFYWRLKKTRFLLKKKKWELWLSAIIYKHFLFTTRWKIFSYRLFNHKIISFRNITLYSMVTLKPSIRCDISSEMDNNPLILASLYHVSGQYLFRNNSTYGANPNKSKIEASKEQQCL